MAIKSNKKNKNYSYDAENKTEVAKGDPKNPESRKIPFAVVEAYKTIRTNLMFLLSQNNGKVIAFSSANAGEGKSTTSVNVAIALSQLGGKVLVIDADMRRSSIHKKLHLDNQVGLANVLASLADCESAIKSVNENLDIMTSGSIPPNPSELLGTEKFDALLAQLKEVYNYIVIDTPPINVVSDALIVAPKTDGLVLVVRDAYTPHDTIHRAIDAAEFANIKLLGTILNGADAKTARRYSYRRYSYGYKYYQYGYGKSNSYRHSYDYRNYSRHDD